MTNETQKWTAMLTGFGSMHDSQVEEIADAIHVRIESKRARATHGTDDPIWRVFLNRDECADWLSDGDWDAGEEINLDAITQEWQSSCYSETLGGRVNPAKYDDED